MKMLLAFKFPGQVTLESLIKTPDGYWLGLQAQRYE